MKYYIFIIFSLFQILSFSQNGHIFGKVFDQNDNTPLIGVNIIFGENQGSSTNFNGEYSLMLPAGKNIISFQYIGFKTETIELNVVEGVEKSKDIFLKSSAQEMDLVVVSAGKFEQKLEEVTVSMDVIKPTLIENKNSTDLEVLMNQSPGVQVVDGQANIRGGSGWSYNTGSRVLVMIDDMPILSGDRGTVEWNMIPMENISQIEVIKGASSVLFGSSAMNGVINVRTAYPKGKPEFKVSMFSGLYDKPKREGLHWWGDDDTRRFNGISFSYAEKKDNTGLVIGGNIYSNDGYKGGFVTNPNSSNYGKELAVSEKWGRFNFSTNHNSSKIPGLSYGINGNLMFLKQYQSLIFENDSVGYTPIGVSEGSEPALFTQMMFNIDPHIKYINTNNNTQHSYKARFFRDDYEPLETEIGFSNVFFQEYQFQKEFNIENKAGNTIKLISTTGLSSNYIKGDYESVYGTDTTGVPIIKQLFNYSAYSQLDMKYNRWNLSFGTRLENLIFNNDNYIIPVIRSGLNYQLAEGTFLRTSFGQGYRFPTIMEMFVETSYDPVYVYASPDLTAESGWSAELGIKQLMKIGNWKGMLDLAGFIMHYDDMIEFSFGTWGTQDWNDPYSNLLGAGFKCINIGATQITGFELSLMGEGKIGDVNVSVISSYTHVNPISLNPTEIYGYSYLTGPPPNYTIVENPINYNSSSHDTIGNILKYRHEHLFKLDLNLDFSKITTGVSIRYNSFMKNMDYVFGAPEFNGGGSGPFSLDVGINDSQERMKDGDLIIDYRIGYRFNDQLSISFIIDNLLNREYQTRPADLGPPRAFTLKLSAKL